MPSLAAASALIFLATGCMHHSYSSSSLRHSFPGGDFSCIHGSMNGERFIHSQELIITDPNMESELVQFQLHVFQDLDRNGKYLAGRDRLLARDTGYIRGAMGGHLPDVEFKSLAEHEPVHYRWVLTTPDGKQHVREAAATG